MSEKTIDDNMRKQYRSWLDKPSPNNRNVGNYELDDDIDLEKKGLELQLENEAHYKQLELQEAMKRSIQARFHDSDISNDDNISDDVYTKLVAGGLCDVADLYNDDESEIDYVKIEQDFEDEMAKTPNAREVFDENFESSFDENVDALTIAGREINIMGSDEHGDQLDLDRVRSKSDKLPTPAQIAAMEYGMTDEPIYNYEKEYRGRDTELEDMAQYTDEEIDDFRTKFKPYQDNKELLEALKGSQYVPLTMAEADALPGANGALDLEDDVLLDSTIREASVSWNTSSMERFKKKGAESDKSKSKAYDNEYDTEDDFELG